MDACFAMSATPTAAPVASLRATCARTIATAATATAAAFLLSTVSLAPQPAYAVISQPICSAGEGPGCAEVEDLPIIRQLQERSRKNKDKNEKAALERYWQEGYGGYFKYSTGKELAKDPETGEWYLKKPDSGLAKAIRNAGIIPEWDPY